MKKRWSRWLEKWGYVLMCVLCAGVILCSALWTRSAQRQEQGAHPSSQSMDESLQDVLRPQETKAPAVCSLPCAGAVLRHCTEEMIFFPEAGVWSTHPGVDVEAPDGTQITAVYPGSVLTAENGKAVISCGEWTFTYLGLKTLFCREGQSLAAGDAVGLSGAWVPYEGRGHVCIRLQDASGAYLNWEKHLIME